MLGDDVSVVDNGNVVGPWTKRGPQILADVECLVEGKGKERRTDRQLEPPRYGTAYISWKSQAEVEQRWR